MRASLPSRVHSVINGATQPEKRNLKMKKLKLHPSYAVTSIALRIYISELSKYLHTQMYYSISWRQSQLQAVQNLQRRHTSSIYLNCLGSLRIFTLLAQSTSVRLLNIKIKKKTNTKQNGILQSSLHPHSSSECLHAHFLFQLVAWKLP